MNFQTDQLLSIAGKSTGYLMVIILGLVLYLLIKRGLTLLRKRENINESMFVFARNIVKWLLITIVVVILLQSTGIRISTILAGLLTIAGMIAIGFIAVWSILSNVLCSMILIAHSSFRIGDEIEVVEPVGGQGLRGRVMEFNVMFTILAEKKDGEVFFTQVPNNIFFQKALRRKPGNAGESLGKHILSRPLFVTSKTTPPKA